MVTARRILHAALCCAYAIACLFLLFFPFPEARAVSGETYRCRWDNGLLTEESYDSAFSALVGVSSAGAIALEREGRSGEISEDALLSRFRTLQSGSLAELLQLDAENVSRLGQAALFYEFGNDVYYAGEEFVYAGGAICRGQRAAARAVHLVEGSLPRRYLSACGAKELYLSAEAEIAPAALEGSAVERITAAAPFASIGNALFLDTPGGRRLVAAAPAAEELSLAASDFADEGALLACTRLRSLTAPYAGSAASWTGSDYAGEFAWLFASSSGYSVPASLKKVKVTGGKLVSRCFYGCSAVEEVDVCGLDPAGIAQDAFADLANWKVLHAPGRGYALAGEYRTYAAPCGCTVYVRI